MIDTAPCILVYVEDPGAANMVLGLGDALAGEQATYQIIAGGLAAGYLRDRHEPITDCRSTAEALDILQTYKPSVVAYGTAEDPVTPAFALAAQAKANGIPTVGLMDGPANPEYRFRGLTHDPLAHAPDMLLVCDATVRTAYAQLGFDSEKIILCGHPSLDRARETARNLKAENKDELRQRCFPDAPAGRPILLFLAELSDGLGNEQFQRGPEYSLQGRGGADGRTEIVLEEVLDAAQLVTPDPYFVMRLHPKTPRKAYAAYDYEIDAYSEGSDLYPSLFAADLVVGLSTVLLFETAVMNRPVLSVLPRMAEIPWLTANSLGLTQYVTTRESLREALVRGIKTPDDFLPSWSNDAIVFGAAKRIARALTAIARGEVPE